MRTFKLQPESDIEHVGRASRKAILTYASQIRHDDVELGRELVNWINELELKIKLNKPKENYEQNK